MINLRDKDQEYKTLEGPVSCKKSMSWLFWGKRGDIIYKW